MKDTFHMLDDLCACGHTWGQHRGGEPHECMADVECWCRAFVATRPDDLFRQSYCNAPMPKVPESVFSYAKLVNDAVDKLSGADPTWNMPHYSNTFRAFAFMPKDQVWLVDSLGKIHKIINIANELREADAISLCIGEMK